MDTCIPRFKMGTTVCYKNNTTKKLEIGVVEEAMFVGSSSIYYQVRGDDDVLSQIRESDVVSYWG